jgi:F1F0 ATPase subunit 2
MIEALPMTLALLAGVSIGVIFFGGLWWTVQKAMSSRLPGLLFAGSFLLRTALTLAVFYLTGRGAWQRLPMCLLGFMLGRILVKRWSRAVANVDRTLLKEGAR